MIQSITIILILFNSQCLTLKLRSVQRNMYMTSSFDFCMRYLTKNSTTGCSSHRSGNRGRLVDIESLNDLTSLEYSYPIIVLIPARKDILEYAIDHAPLIVGILIDGQQANETDDYFTEVSTCPEDFIGISRPSNCSIRKNTNGIDFRGKLIEKPIFLLTNQTMVDELRKVIRLYKGSHIGVHMKSYPYGAENAEICNRRSKPNYFGETHFKNYIIKCRSPMINIVWSMLNIISTKDTRPPKSVVILYTKFDVFSIFQPINAGAQSTGFGVVILLGLAWLLGRINLSQMLISNKIHQDLILLFINGQNWNYYGTFELSRMILEQRFPFKTNPIESKHIDIIINLDQLGISHNHTYILYDNIHPFLEKYKELSNRSVILEQMSDVLGSMNDFHLLNVTTVALLTDAYENMNPLFNSYQDTLMHINDYSLIEDHIYSLVQTICHYFHIPTCLDSFSVDMKQAFSGRIQALFDCFLRSNCSNIITETDETNKFYFREVSDNMEESFSFLQPVLQQSDVKKYIDNHFFYASSYIHDILLNWIAMRKINTTKTKCDEIEDVVNVKIYQKSTNTCLYGLVDSINLIRTIDTPIDDRILFTSNYDEPELLVYMINDSMKDIITLKLLTNRSYSKTLKDLPETATFGIRGLMYQLCTQNWNEQEIITSISEIPTRNIMRDRRHMARNYFLIWVAANVDLENEEFKNSLTQLHGVVSDIKVCLTSTECIKILNEIDEGKAFVILSETLGQQLVPEIHGMHRVHTIHIYNNDQTENLEWIKDYRKIQGVSNSIKSICESLDKVTHMCDHNDILMSFIPKEMTTAIISADANEQIVDQLPPSYMYSVMFKQIVLEVDDDHSKQMDALVEYCRKKHVYEAHLMEFQNQYHEKSPVYWYTRDMFLYRQLNKALRTLDMEAMMKMGFFIRHLHLQLQQLHQDQSPNFREKFTVYRGQALSEEEFQKLCSTKGGLLSFNNFISTSKEKEVVTVFAPNAIEPDNDTIGVIFIITIDPNETSIATMPFALIEDHSAISGEEEILFTMHTVFRITDIKETGTNTRLWEVELTLTDDNDPDMTALTNQLNQEISERGWYRMGRLMLNVGYFEQAEELYNELLKDVTSDGEKQYIYHHLGLSKIHQGDYQTAAILYENSLQINLKIVPKDHISLASCYTNMSLLYHKSGDHLKALEFQEKAFKMLEKNLPPNHRNIGISYNNLGELYRNIGDYAKALEFYEKSIQITKEALLLNHPEAANPYNNMGKLYAEMDNFSKALEYYEKALKIMENALPPNHPSLATSYSNVGEVYNNMCEYFKGLEFYEKSLKVRERILSSTHPDLATAYIGIGYVYENLGEYFKSLEYYGKSQEILEKALSLNHSELARCYYGIGQVYMRMCEYSKALEFLEKSLILREQCVSPKQQDLAACYNNIGVVYENTGDYIKALEFQVKSLQIKGEVLSPNHPAIAVSCTNIGSLYKILGQYSKAMEFHEMAAKIFENALYPNYLDLATSYGHIGALYFSMGIYQTALEFAEKAVATLKKSVPPTHPLLQAAMHNVNCVKAQL